MAHIVNAPLYTEDTSTVIYDEDSYDSSEVSEYGVVGGSMFYSEEEEHVSYADNEIAVKPTTKRDKEPTSSEQGKIM